MKLLSLDIKDFGVIGEASVDFERYDIKDKVLIIGENQDAAGADSNGAGKSTLLNAISWAIFGRIPTDVSASDIIRRGKSLCKVRLRLLDESNKEIIIERERKLAGGHAIKWFLDGESQTQRTLQQTQKTLLNYFGILENNTEYFADFLNTTYFSIDAVKAFAGKKSTSKDRMNLISRFLNLEILDRCTSKAKVYSNNIKGEIKTLEGQTEFIENKLEEAISPTQIESDNQADKAKIKNYKNENYQLKQEIKILEQLEEIEEHAEDNIAAIERVKGDQETIVEVYNKQIEDLKNKLDNQANISSEIEKLEQLSNDLSAALKDKDLDKYSTWLNEGRIVLVRMEDKIDDLSTQLKTHLTCPDCNCELMMENGDLVKFEKNTLQDTISKEKSAYRKKQKAFNKKESEYNSLLEIEDEVKGYDFKIRKLYQESKELHAIPAKIETLEADIKEKTKSSRDYLKELEKKKIVYQIKLKKYAEYDATLLPDVRSTLEINENNVQDLRDAISRRDTILSAYIKDKGELDKLLARLAELHEELGNYMYWVEGFPAIRRWMIESFLPSFEEQTNSYLNRMEVGMRVRFDTLTEKHSKRGEYKNQFDLAIIDENNEKRDIETYSQGEAKRIGVCVGFALRELTLNKGYSNFNFLLMDEVIDSLDETGIGEFFNLLSSITGTKFLITHNTDLKSRFGNVIKVIKEEGVSSISQ